MSTAPDDTEQAGTERAGADASARPARGDWRERLNAVLVASVTVGLLTLVATLFRMNERDLTNVLSPVDTFLLALGVYVLPTTVLVIVLVAAGMLGAFRHWFFAGLAGFAGGIVGGVVGYVQRIVASGLELGGDAWAAIMLEFFGLNFAFLAAATVVAGIGAPVVAARIDRREREAQTRGGGLGDPRRFAEADDRIAFVRVPATDLEAAEVTHIERVEVDAELAAEQWEAYVELLERYGWETREVAAAETLADAVFTEDQVVLLDDVALLARSGAASRRPERAGVRAAVAEAGFVIEEVEKPATLDGGDVLVNGDTVFVRPASGRFAASRRRSATGSSPCPCAAPCT